MLQAALTVAALGCTPRYAPGDHTIQLGDRHFELFVPANVTTPAPLVVHLHGCGTLVTSFGFWPDGPRYEAVLTHINVSASNYGWMVAHPQGVLAKNGTCVNPGDERTRPSGFNAGGCCGDVDVDDVSFLTDLVKYMVDEQCVPADRVYATGFSTGAMMAHRLACEAPGLFNGLAAVEGNMEYGKDFHSCTPKSTTNFIMMCGTEDSVCVDGFAGNVTFWQEQMQCTGEEVTTLDTATTRCTRQAKCSNGGDLEWCTTKGLSHCWPGGDPRLRLGICPREPSSDVDASDYILSVLNVWNSATRPPAP